jgi:predicted transposase/invertase (TIGR01784 family)
MLTSLKRYPFVSLPCAIRRLSDAPKSTFEKRYAIPTADTAFKHMLYPEEKNQEILKSFLSAFVPKRFEKDAILSVMPLGFPPLKRQTGKKQIFMDLYVKTASTHYIVEMQAQRHQNFDVGALYYACATFTRQMQEATRGKWYDNLDHVIAVQVLDYDSNKFRVHDTSPAANQHLKMKDDVFMKHYMFRDEWSEQIIDQLQLVQIELPRWRSIIARTKKHHRDFDSKDWWLELFCSADKYTPEMLSKLKAEKVDIPPFFEMALGRLDLNLWAPEMVKKYNIETIDREFFADAFAVAFAEGVTKGLLEAKGLLKAARVMKKQGMSDAKIAEELGLQEADVAKLE